MADRSAHLDQLKIDRSRPAPSPWRGILVAVLAVLLLGAAGGGGWYYFEANAGIPIHAATVEGGGGGGGAGLDASGYVVARRQATLSAKILGKLVEVNVEEGQRIEKGAVVARLDDSNLSAELRQARAQEAQAKAAFDDIGPIFARYQRLRDQGAISIDQFETQRAAFDAAKHAYAVAQSAVAVAESLENDTVIRAPYSGIVTDRAAQVGETVAPSAAGGGQTRTGIATIVDMDSLEVEVDVSENYIDRVTAGQKATIQLTAYPDWDIPASVIAIIPTADQSKGTVKVRVAINAKDARILPQMGARVSFLTQGQQPVSRALTLPPGAVAGDGAAGTVFLIHDDKIEARQVKVGLRTSQAVTILS
ncbi:MAG TPA: efflux RND transporter periplasmic adaptor subunit, partial [Rhizomicrobium sp.]|nr:efflux RND transporter periplasmic adaptor subunit [Rhizomicrobium sp.]